MKVCCKLVLFNVLMLLSTLGVAQVFIPTIRSDSTDKNNQPIYKITILPNLTVPLHVSLKLKEAMYSELHKSFINADDFNKLLNAFDWNENKINKTDIAKVVEVSADFLSGSAFITYHGSTNKIIATYMSSYFSGFYSKNSPINSLRNEVVKTQNDISESHQFCINFSNTNPPDYKKLNAYLERNHSPCPNETRGRWAKAQFYRLGKRIEELHKVKPQQAANLMREFNEKLQPFIVSEAYSGFEDDNGFLRCINFLNNVDKAVDNIRNND